MFCKKGVFKRLAFFTGKHALESLFNTFAGLQACNFIKKRLQDRCFLSEICENLKKTHFEEHMETTASEKIDAHFAWVSACQAT